MNKDLIKGIILGIILTMCSCYIIGDVEIETDFRFDRDSNAEQIDSNL